VKRISAAVRRKAKKIRLLLLDVDGVLTDGRIIIDDRGVETKQFHVRDGQGITLLRRSGVGVGIITGRSSKVVKHRAKELGIKIVRQGVEDKLAAYAEIRSKVQLSDDQIAYVGDDIVDLPILRKTGLAIAVRDSWTGLEPYVDLVTEMGGGNGAVREVAELILKAQGKWSSPAKRTAQAPR
jgi:3-deoxy-D-manno-octulosonate 8-phosphate phosphatase (KDO 8-P phosphatase)